MKRNAVRIMTLLLAVVFAFCGCASSPEKPVYELSHYAENNDLLGGMLRVENGVLVDETAMRLFCMALILATGCLSKHG